MKQAKDCCIGQLSSLSQRCSHSIDGSTQELWEDKKAFRDEQNQEDFVKGEEKRPQLMQLLLAFSANKRLTSLVTNLWLIDNVNVWLLFQLKLKEN